MRKERTDHSQYLKAPYSRVLIPNDDGTYSAEILELHGCYAQGDTPNEAIQNLEAAAQDWIEAALAMGQVIPEPSINAGYSGHFALRLPRGLHRQASRMAKRDGTSLNQFLVTAVSARVGAEDFYSYLAERFERRLTVTAANITISSGVISAEQLNTPALNKEPTSWMIVPNTAFPEANRFQIPGPRVTSHG
jgi:predicted RNase H-like HicB family nuclease